MSKYIWNKSVLNILKKKLQDIVLGTLFVFSGLIFAILMPLGVGPDDNWHIAMSYCAWGEKKEICQDNTKTDNTGVWSYALAPKKINELGACFRQNYSLSGYCSEPLSAPMGTHFKILAGEGTIRKKNIYKATQQINRNLFTYALDVECDSECSFFLTSSSNESSNLNKFFVERKIVFDEAITIVPSINGGTLNIFFGKEASYNFDLIENGGKFAHEYNKELGKVLSPREIEEIKSKKINKFELDVIWPAYSYYPSTYYKLTGWLATKNVTMSVWNMRFFSLFLLSCVVLVSMLLLRQETFRSVIGILTITGIPMGFFLFGTNNPSLYGWLYATFFAAWAYDFLDNRVNKFNLKFIIALILITFLSSVRSDVIIFNLVILSILIVLKRHYLNIKSVIFGYSLTIAIYFLFSGNSVGINSHANFNFLSNSQSFPLHILVEFVSVLMGNFGDRGPLNLWGLSWYDIPLPSLVSVTMTSIIAYILFSSLSRSKDFISVFALILGVLFMCLFLVIALITTQENPPGGFIQPRYMLPLFSSVSLIIYLNYNSNRKRINQNINISGIFIMILIFLSSFSATVISTTRFGNGIAVVKEPWLEFFANNKSFTWVGEQRILYQIPNSDFFYSPILSSFVIIIMLIFAHSLSVAFLSKDIIKNLQMN